MDENGQELLGTIVSNLDILALTRKDTSSLKLFEYKLAKLNIGNSWHLLPTQTKEDVMVQVKIHLGSQVGGALVSVIPSGGEVVTIVLVATVLGLEAIRSIRKWWKGEISGERCAKSIIDASVTVTAGVGGGIVGGIGGSAAAVTLLGLGPLGIAISMFGGALVLGSTSSALAGCTVKEITCRLFDLPQDEALEKAYNYLRLRSSSKNGELNSVYKKLARQHHPDRGGDKEKFQELQICMEIIKASREM